MNIIDLNAVGYSSAFCITMDVINVIKIVVFVYQRYNVGVIVRAFFIMMVVKSVS